MLENDHHADDSHPETQDSINSPINTEDKMNHGSSRQASDDTSDQMSHMTPKAPKSSKTHSIHEPTLKRMWHAFYNSAIYERSFLRRNRWDFSVLFWMPLAIIIIVWWIFSRPFIVDLPIGVIDDSHSSYSHTLTRYLDASPDINVSKVYSSPAAAQDALMRQQIYAIIIIPQNFARNINQGQAAPIILKVNAQFSSHSGIIQRGVQSSVGTFSAGVEIKRSIKQGVSPSQAKIDYSPISINRINLFNTGSNYQQFLASTVLPALLHILAMIIGATTIGREIRDRSFYEWCRAMLADSATYAIPQPSTTPIDPKSHDPLLGMPILAHHQFRPISRSIQYRLRTAPLAPPVALNHTLQPPLHRPTFAMYIAGLHGKFIWTILAYALWGALALTLAVQYSHVGLDVWAVTYFAYLLLLLLSIWLGAILSVGSYSLRTGLSLTGFISAPSYAFAGVAYPYIAITDSAKYWADGLPLTHYLKLQIGLLQMDAPIDTYRSIIIGLAISTFICLLLTAVLCKRAYAHPERWGGR